MKKRYLMLAMTSMAFADEAAQPNFYEYHNRIAIFEPLHQAYERIKPDAFYAGVETWASHILSDEHGSNQFIGEAELRMGYNYFYNGRDHVTPFLGFGVFKDFRKERVGHFRIEHGTLVHEHHKREKPAVIYGVFGVLYDHEFNSIFTLGVNFKGLIGGSASKEHWNWGSPVGGIDFSVPITFRLGPKRHWDIRLEPFYIYMHGSRIARNYFGGRSTVGYRF